jgi:hypothetical protein
MYETTIRKNSSLRSKPTSMTCSSTPPGPHAPDIATIRSGLVGKSLGGVIRTMSGSRRSVTSGQGIDQLRSASCPRYMVVRDVSTDKDADAWVEASAEGFCLHFSAKDRDGEWHGQTEPMSDIAPSPSASRGGWPLQRTKSAAVFKRRTRAMLDFSHAVAGSNRRVVLPYLRERVFRRARRSLPILRPGNVRGLLGGSIRLPADTTDATAMQGMRCRSRDATCRSPVRRATPDSGSDWSLQVQVGCRVRSVEPVPYRWRTTRASLPRADP